MSVIDTKLLREFVTLLQRGMDAEGIYEAVFDLLERTCQFDSATLFIYEPESNQLKVIHQKGKYVVDLAGEIPFARGAGLSSYTSTQRNPIILESLHNARAGREGRFSSFVSLPLWSEDSLIGVLNLGHSEPGKYQRSDLEEFELLASQISLVFSRVLLSRRLVEQNTALQKAMQELTETQKQLIDKERFAAIGEIIVTVNHEINNPLSTIIGLAEILDMTAQTAKPEKVREAIKAIITQAKRIQKITHQLSSINAATTQEYIDGLKMIKISA